MSWKQKCNKSDVVSNLRSVLSNLHWTSRECIDCEWVDHEDKFYRCKVCEEWSCGDCQEFHVENCGADCIECKQTHCRASVNVSMCDTCDEWLCDECSDKHLQKCLDQEQDVAYLEFDSRSDTEELGHQAKRLKHK